MSKINSKLARQPNEYHEFDHNGQIKELLIALGVESHFKKSAPEDKATNQALLFGEHPTHWILFVLYQGYADPVDNGYVSWCLPKRKVSHERFMEFSRKVLNPTDERMLSGNVFWSKPGNPSN